MTELSPSVTSRLQIPTGRLSRRWNALIIGAALALLCRRWPVRVLWALWPGWVVFSVMATANHFWLDCVAGFGVALLAAATVNARRIANAL